MDLELRLPLTSDRRESAWLIERAISLVKRIGLLVKHRDRLLIGTFYVWTRIDTSTISRKPRSLHAIAAIVSSDEKTVARQR